MITFPNCKINIGLRILNRRADGFHNISTVFFPLPFYDLLEIIPSDKQRLHLSGIPIEGNEKHNLCLQAYDLLKKDFPKLPPYSIYLHKNIPMGAGLGGGSANAAFMLKLINDKAQLQLSKKELLNYAAHLGSDCSFFIENTPCLAKNRGETLTPISIPHLKGYHLLLFTPDIPINTAQAYQNIQPESEEIPLSYLIQKPVKTWKKYIKNDFEKVVFKKQPLLKEIKEALYSHGAVYAALSGSGSTVYGLFAQKPNISSFSFNNTLVKHFPLD